MFYLVAYLYLKSEVVCLSFLTSYPDSHRLLFFNEIDLFRIMIIMYRQILNHGQALNLEEGLLGGRRIV